jgi:antitoxin MazE
MSARVIRNLLVDYVRDRKVAKRGGGAIHLPLDDDMEGRESRTVELLALNEALTALGRHDERLERVVECRFFAGMSTQETAERESAGGELQLDARPVEPGSAVPRCGAGGRPAAACGLTSFACGLGLCPRNGSRSAMSCTSNWHGLNRTQPGAAGAMQCFGRDATFAQVAHMCYSNADSCEGKRMVKKITLRQVDGSIGATLPKDMADRLHVKPGDEVFVIETGQGILLTPYDPTFERAMAAYQRTAGKYRNALRELSK